MANAKNKYVLEGSHAEVERLQKQHLWFQSTLKNQIVFAPVDLKQPGFRVLDVGCADGTLLRDLQRELSSDAELVGLDVSESFLPASPQGNIRYTVGDLTQPFPEDLQSAFDLTHLRYTIAGTGKVSIETVVAGVAATLKPGGWLQIQEPDLSRETWAGQESALADFVTVLGAVLDKIGAGRGYATHLEAAFRKAGLENVSVERVTYPLGVKAETEEIAKQSVEQFKTTIKTATATATAFGGDFPPSAIDNLEERFEREMSEKGGAYRGLIVIGQRKAT